MPSKPPLARELPLCTRFVLACLATVLLAGACGYHVAGRADTLPDSIGVIAIPTFQNATTEFKIEQYMTQAVVREFISRTRYKIVSDEAPADATLSGVVVNFLVFPVIFDPATGRATSIATLTQMRVNLRDRKTGETLYENLNFEYREHYEVSTNPDAYFEERQSALRRSSQAAARILVSAVLERF